jgi:hypothetical protein
MMKFHHFASKLIVVAAMMVVMNPLAVTSAFSPTAVVQSSQIQPHHRQTILKSSASSSSWSVMDDTTTTPTVAALRDIRVTNVQGDRIRLGDVLGDQKSVLVFMRHLGCPYCWSYAQDIMQLQSRIETVGASGPWLISIGDVEKLARFLEINPDIPKTHMFVDDYQFQAYETAGFVNKLNDPNPLQDENTVPPPLTAPNLGGISGWWNYLTNAIALAPIEKENPPAFGTMPEGVLRLGGTLVIDGDQVVYQWYDRIPGDHPDLEQVMQMVEQQGNHNNNSPETPVTQI